MNCKFFTTPLSRNSQKGLEHKENRTKYGKMTRKPRGHVRILICWTLTWAIVQLSLYSQCTPLAIKSPKGTSVYWYYLIVFKLPTTMQYKKEKNFRHQIAGAHKQERAASCARVTAFSRTRLFLERFWHELWISFKFYKNQSEKTYRPKNDIFLPFNNV